MKLAWLAVGALIVTGCSKTPAEQRVSAQPASAPAASSSWRLPRGVVPEHYTLKVTPDLAKATFAGEESIDVRLEQSTDRIVLNAAEITFQSVAVDAGGATQTARVDLDPKTEMATFTVPKAR